MNYLVLIIIALAGIALGYYLARRARTTVQSGGFNAEQIKEKAENKEKILQFVCEYGRVKNNDVEKLAGVGDATAERYLSELEKEGKLTQHGTIGHDVFYTLT